jgi:hypothetical protein
MALGCASRTVFAQQPAMLTNNYVITLVYCGGGGETADGAMSMEVHAARVSFVHAMAVD